MLLPNMPDFSNPRTRAAELKIGEFNFVDNPAVNEDDLISRGPYELDNGAIYHGQWTNNGMREGKGI